MIDGKIIKAGYGDIAVGNFGWHIQFTPFKPPLEVGTTVRDLFGNGDIVPTGDTITITLNSDSDFAELKAKLEGVRPKKASKIFEFKGYTFDFSNYNEKSVEVFERVRCVAHIYYLQVAAC